MCHGLLNGNGKWQQNFLEISTSVQYICREPKIMEINGGSKSVKIWASPSYKMNRLYPTFVPRIFRQQPTYFSYQHDLESNPTETNTFSGCFRYQVVGIFVFRTFLSFWTLPGHKTASQQLEVQFLLTSSNSFISASSI